MVNRRKAATTSKIFIINVAPFFYLLFHYPPSSLTLPSNHLPSAFPWLWSASLDRDHCQLVLRPIPSQASFDSRLHLEYVKNYDDCCPGAASIPCSAYHSVYRIAAFHRPFYSSPSNCLASPSTISFLNVPCFSQFAFLRCSLPTSLCVQAVCHGHGED